MVSARLVLAILVLAGCPVEPAGVCGLAATGAGGSVELGLGEPFTPVVQGMEVKAQFGLQGLTMFVVNARVRDLAVADAEIAVDIQLTGDHGEELSRDSGCRARMFTDIGGGMWQLYSPQFLGIEPDYNAALDGMAVTLRVTVTDAQGLRAFDERTFTARAP